uniref:ArfGAP with dual PH domains 2 n=1 Tax=Scleropages formosus TaxID=113540 RepID=A0A8C9VCG8_SCLFO
MSNWDRNKKILLDLVKEPGNDRCADCGAPDPDWASCSLGIFVCLDCSGPHRSLPAASRIKSIRLDFWDDELVEFMKANGNANARAFYERSVPSFYYRPQQWDSAYVLPAKITVNNYVPGPPPGAYQGILWKKGKDKGQFQKRKFVLSDVDFTLKYFNKEDTKGPKAVIFIKTLNAIFQPEKIGHPHGLQITFLEEGRTRNLFVYHESGQEIVNWFNAIRATRLAYLKTAFPTASDSELIPWITRNYTKEGYMEKTGPMQREAFRKRWFVLDSQERKLLYFKTQLDAVELGAVFIGPEDMGYSVTERQPRGTRGNKWKFGMMVETPERQFIFMCEQEREQKEWLEAIGHVISKPMLPQDYATEANLRRKR